MNKRAIDTHFIFIEYMAFEVFIVPRKTIALFGHLTNFDPFLVQSVPNQLFA